MQALEVVKMNSPQLSPWVSNVIANESDKAMMTALEFIYWYITLLVEVTRPVPHLLFIPWVAQLQMEPDLCACAWSHYIGHNCIVWIRKHL